MTVCVVELIFIDYLKEPQRRVESVIYHRDGFTFNGLKRQRVRW